VRLKFTDASVADLQPDPDPKKRLTVWDTELRAFGVVVTPPGRKGGGVRSFIIQYRVGGRAGKTRRVTIGHHGTISVKQARLQASELLIQVRKGHDPFEDKRRLDEERRKALLERNQEESRQERLNFVILGEEFIEEHCKAKQPKSWRRSEHGLKLLQDRFARRRIDELDRGSIRLAYTSLLEKETKGAAMAAHKALSGLFGYAVKEKLLHPSLNPMVDLDPPARDIVRERTLSVDELREVWDAAGDVGYPFGAFVRFLILTMQRRTECGRAEWPEIHDRQSLWIIPADRMKREESDARGDQVVPITPFIKEFLDALPRVAQSTNADDKPGATPKARYLFTSAGRAPIAGYSDAKEQLDAKIPANRRRRAEAAGDEWDAATSSMKPWRFHDLRRTVSTMLQALGQSDKIIDLLQDHKPTGPSKVARHYQLYEFLEEKADVMGVWSNFLSELITDCEEADEAEKKPLVAKVRRRHVPRN
jgi:integrase